MATQQQKNELISSIKDQLKTALSYDLEKDLVRNSDLGSLSSFESLRTEFIALLSIAERINTIDLTKCSETHLRIFYNDFSLTHAHLNSIKKFNTTLPNSVNRREQLIRDFQVASDKAIASSGPLLWTSQLADFNNKSQTELHEILEGVKNEAEQSKSQALESLKEIQEVLKSVQSAAGKVGVSSHSTIFKEEAEKHEEEAKKWLKYIVRLLIAIGSISIVFIALLFCPLMEDASLNWVQFSISKVIFLAIFFIALSICSKNYKAHKHNAVLNKHRQNALNTFEAFVKAAGTDEQTKSAVLLQTTQSIFANHNTGYNSAETDSDISSKIIEIVKSTQSRPSGS
jgi:hypothetical protein